MSKFPERLTEPKRLTVDYQAGARLGYRHPVLVLRAAKRALRWIQSRRHQGEKMPTHIAMKSTLLRMGQV